MFAILILGSSSVIGGAVLTSGAVTAPARLVAATSARREADRPARPRFDAPARDATPSGRVVCTIRVLSADTDIDREMVRAVERPVDPEMVFSPPCSSPSAPAP